MVDKRTARSKEMIKDSFIKLLKIKNLNEIKVTELVELAEIGRGTFYLHYQDVYDLHEQIEIELYHNLLKYINATDLELMATNIIEYVDTHKDILLIITRDSEYLNPEGKLKEILVAKIQDNYTNSADQQQDLLYSNIEIHFVISGIAGVIEKWLKDGLTIPKDRLISSLHKILLKID